MVVREYQGHQGGGITGNSCSQDPKARTNPIIRYKYFVLFIFDIFKLVQELIKCEGNIVLRANEACANIGAVVSRK